MDRKELRKRIDEALKRVQSEIQDLPTEYSREAWEQHKTLLERMRGLSEMRALFATEIVVRKLTAEEIKMEELIY